MARWLGILLAIGFAATSADAQVFKPKTKKTGTSEKATKKASSEKSEKTEKTEKADKTDKSEKAEKKARSAPTKKRVTTKPKKGGKHSDDAASEDAPKESDKDFVKITDDDDAE